MSTGFCIVASRNCGLWVWKEEAITAVVPDHLIPVCLAALAAGLTQGLAGFGSVLVALPLLVFFLDLPTAVPLASIWGMTINVMLLAGLWRQVRAARILPLTLAALPGVPLGVYLLRQVPVRLLELSLGLVLIGFSGYVILSRGRTKVLGRGWEYLAGFLSGCLGGSLAASGPPVITRPCSTGIKTS